MDYKSIRLILDSNRDTLEDLVLRVACEYPKEFRHCAILNNLINDIEVIVTWDNQRIELKSSVMNQIRDYAKAGNKVEAVKLLRNESGIGLKDALETIKQLFPELDATREKQRAEENRALGILWRNPAPDASAPREPTPFFTTQTPDLTYFDRRPTDPGYVDPHMTRVLDAAPVDALFDIATGISLGELLRQQVADNEFKERAESVADDIVAALRVDHSGQG